MPTLGSYGNQIGPTVTGFQLYNKDSVVDKTMLSFSMWKTTIKIAIYPLIESEDDQVRYDRKNGLAIYLTPMKAFMFANIIRDFKKNPHNTNTRGIFSGTNLITIEDPTNPNGFNKPDAGPIIVLRKVNSDNGTMEASYAYEIRFDNAAIIENYNEKNRNFVKNVEEFKFIELDMIALQLEEYAKAMTNATAFAVSDSLYGCLDKIASKLGVDLNSAYNANNGGGYKQSYFASSNGTNYGANGLDKMMGNNIPF